MIQEETQVFRISGKTFDPKKIPSPKAKQRLAPLRGAKLPFGELTNYILLPAFGETLVSEADGQSPSSGC